VVITQVDRAASWDGLDTLIGQTVAMGDPTHVPAGMYAKQALGAAGVWAAVEPHINPTMDVAAAVRLVDLGEVPYGIVYATDAAASEKVREEHAFEPRMHEPIVYPIALRPGAPESVREFMAFVQSDAARTVIARYGFGVIEE
jgi:molybdate transport system substrate-binding protein